MKTRILLGFTENKEVVFADVENKSYGFSASFDTSYPMEINDEIVIERIEGYLESMDSDWTLDKLNTYDCKPSELAQNLYNDAYNVVEEFFDNSLYSESFRINGVENDIYFLASGAGQHDTRKEMKDYLVSKELYDYIHELWDEYHLKEIPVEKMDKLEKMLSEYDDIDEDELVENWLKENFNK